MPTNNFQHLSAGICGQLYPYTLFQWRYNTEIKKIKGECRQVWTANANYPTTNAIWGVIVGVGKNCSPLPPPLVLLNMLVALEFAVINT